MTYLAAIAATLLFALTLRILGIVPAALQAIHTARNAMQAITSATKSESEKERIARRAAVNLMLGFFSILLRGGAAFGVSLLCLLVLEYAGVASLSDVTDLLATWRGLLLGSAILAVAYFVRHPHV